MVKLNKIYTKTGDDGTTGLVRGPRRRKSDLRVAAFGTVDEANSAIGMARIYTESMPKIDTMLSRIQNDLFDLGSDLATPGVDAADQPASLRITPNQTNWVERRIDQFNEGLPALNSFVLPGGTPLAALMHVARTIVRRAEREVVELAEIEPDTSPEVIRYLNRLSDLMFVLARVANSDGRKDVLWVPGEYAGDDTNSR